METADVLLVIDMQNGVCHYENQTISRFDQLTSGINDRIAAYEDASKPVIFVQHDDDYLFKGSDKWKVIPELDTTHAYHYIEKTHPNAFYQTELKSILDQLDVQSIEVCGAETHYCIDSTVKFAHGSGYAVYMKKKLHSSWDSEWMTPDEIADFYEQIWTDRFLTFI